MYLFLIIDEERRVEEYYKNKYKNVLHRIKCLKHTAYIEVLHSSDRLFESAILCWNQCPMIGQKGMVPIAASSIFTKVEHTPAADYKRVRIDDSWLSGGWCSSKIRNQSVHPLWFPVDQQERLGRYVQNSRNIQWIWFFLVEKTDFSLL